GAEAVIFFDPALGADAAYARKQATQLASKMRFLAAQFSAYLADDLWRELAGHANAMARRAADGLADVVTFACPVEVNMLFPRLPAAVLAPLAERFDFHVWDADRGIARWLTSFDTRAADVDALVAAVRAALDANA
ncbi:MAG: threonine aldolase, partial [Gammaproteobacteria bacterium]